jgi:hypothetical protein
MSLFEFVTVMVSMILALSLGQLLNSLSYLAKTNNEIVPSRPYMLWLTAFGIMLVNHWWSLWDLRDITWNYASFLYVLIAPALITFAVGLFVPDREEGGPIDLSTQFLRIRPSVAKVMLAYILVMWFDGPIIAGHDVFGLVGLLHIPLLAAVSMSLLSNNTRLNTITPIVMIIVLLIVIIVRFST